MTILDNLQRVTVMTVLTYIDVLAPEFCTHCYSSRYVPNVAKRVYDISVV